MILTKTKNIEHIYRMVSKYETQHSIDAKVIESDTETDLANNVLVKEDPLKHFSYTTDKNEHTRRIGIVIDLHTQH